ncbi:hypothetical protein [Stenotrophomonas maltophilia]|uniref:hypothetical protein n=1 Tax=Stenotrophomonas maltophilia TaxID=40324 RepID=UPI0012FD6F8C|nr:hypothetical protein [Stenotrophomonas maltophilia]
MNLDFYNPIDDQFLLYANERKERFVERRRLKDEEKAGELRKPKRAVLKPATKWSFSVSDLDSDY